MGSAASTTEERILSEIKQNGSPVDTKVQDLVNTFVEHRQLDEEKLLRDRTILLIKQLESEINDQRTALELSRLSPKEQNRPGEQRRLRKLIKRRKTPDLRRIIGELKEFQVDTRRDLLEAFPPLHSVDRSIDSQMCAEVLVRFGIHSARAQQAIAQTAVKLRRELR
mmetsp:Transcript_25047/g.51459  ORF Transcript_25047/g.51459 Transcript_25047/m.51459 type:complete len:167 (-) Transcript_25047:190-690(-)|eukprot:CAMPEP_0171623526 /NCGR_PEP_ID=MMETSP0990-20121206/18015_1 /TAXON_ID=483369 /ORGANISM="non described non described, Strain CCMP2098" /LENGTH=166 /DNA_ID=CAMNT_0012189779 /DNA_START=88 /DNA_END=588 /DNA_ORIENTATION=-